MNFWKEIRMLAAELHKDKARLDWLASGPGPIWKDDDQEDGVIVWEWSYREGCSPLKGKTLREAIDGEMEKKKMAESKTEILDRLKMVASGDKPLSDFDRRAISYFLAELSEMDELRSERDSQDKEIAKLREQLFRFTGSL